MSPALLLAASLTPFLAGLVVLAYRGASPRLARSLALAAALAPAVIACAALFALESAGPGVMLQGVLGPAGIALRLGVDGLSSTLLLALSVAALGSLAGAPVHREARHELARPLLLLGLAAHVLVGMDLVSFVTAFTGASVALAFSVGTRGTSRARAGLCGAALVAGALLVGAVLFWLHARAQLPHQEAAADLLSLSAWGRRPGWGGGAAASDPSKLASLLLLAGLAPLFVTALLRGARPLIPATALLLALHALLRLVLGVVPGAASSTVPLLAWPALVLLLLAALARAGEDRTGAAFVALVLLGASAFTPQGAVGAVLLVLAGTLAVALRGAESDPDARLLLGLAPLLAVATFLVLIGAYPVHPRMVPLAAAALAIAATRMAVERRLPAPAVLARPRHAIFLSLTLLVFGLVPQAVVGRFAGALLPILASAAGP